MEMNKLVKDVKGLRGEGLTLLPNTCDAMNEPHRSNAEGLLPWRTMT